MSKRQIQAMSKYRIGTRVLIFYPTCAKPVAESNPRPFPGHGRVLRTNIGRGSWTCFGEWLSIFVDANPSFQPDAGGDAFDICHQGLEIGWQRETDDQAVDLWHNVPDDHPAFDVLDLNRKTQTVAQLAGGGQGFA